MSIKRKPERDKSKYISYNELREYVRDEGILLKNNYLNHLKSTHIFKNKIIPYNPSTFYDKDTWEGWSIFLRDEIYKKKYNNTYYSYNECKKAIIKYNFKSKLDFINRIKNIIINNIKIPYNPPSVYKEWEGWVEFLGTDNDIEQITNLVDFKIAKKYATNLKLKLQRQWNDIKFSDLPKGMTKKPDKLYRNKGWIDWYDFLGINIKSNMSYGELIISNLLDENNIKYNYNKPLKDCTSVCKLRFDFYLIDYNICIEYDGKQHFKSIKWFGGDKEFENVKLRDSIKNKWCLENKIKLIRFNYNQETKEIEDQLMKIISKK